MFTIKTTIVLSIRKGIIWGMINVITKLKFEISTLIVFGNLIILILELCYVLKVI